MSSLARKMNRQHRPRKDRGVDYFPILENKPRTIIWDAPSLSMSGVSEFAHRDGETPADARARGVGYAGPKMPDKGQKDGSCNRGACQLPLAGRQQWTMKDHVTGGKLYYCADCAHKFNESDREFGEPLRCTMEE
jgi:hypothetical protein